MKISKFIRSDIQNITAALSDLVHDDAGLEMLGQDSRSDWINEVTKFIAYFKNAFGNDINNQIANGSTFYVIDKFSLLYQALRRYLKTDPSENNSEIYVYHDKIFVRNTSDADAIDTVLLNSNGDLSALNEFENFIDHEMFK